MAGKKRIKKVIKKRNNENAKKDISSRILLIIFLILCVVVFVLATIMITENAKSKNNKYDIRVPLTKEEISDGIDIKINMDDVSKNQSKEYRIQLTNYLEDEVNNQIIKYQMKLSTSNKTDKVDIELYSNKDNFELLEGNKKIKGLSLGKTKKEKVTYTLKLTQRKAPIDKQYVNVKITEDK